MLYTGKGDKGTTKLLKTPKGERVSKSSPEFEALGSLDEVNSFLGLCKVLSSQNGYKIKEKNITFEEIIHTIQKDLFIIQAELAGSDMTITKDKVFELEQVIDAIERELPPIKTFFVPGGTPDVASQPRGAAELAAFFDVARTFARRTERRVISVVEAGGIKVCEHSLAYLNRLSSLLYALARLTNHKRGIVEQPPDYK